MPHQRQMSRSASPPTLRDTWRNLELMEVQNGSTHVLEKGTRFALSFDDVSSSTPGLGSARTASQWSPHEQGSGDVSPVEYELVEDYRDRKYSEENNHQAQAPELRGVRLELQSIQDDFPSLADTCSRFLSSINSFVDPYQHNAIKKDLSAFQQGAGVHLQRMLEARQDDPSWHEELCDDKYLSNREPLPINVNYFYGFKSFKKPLAMTQVGRAASLLHAALEVYVQIRDGTFPTDHENKEPLCMSQMRRVFCASRIPGETRDSIVSYSTAPLTADERLSKTCHYVATSPTHCVVIVRNRFYRVQVLDPTTHAVLSFIDIASAIEYAAAAAISAKEPAPPVGLLTTMHRGGWAEAYAHLKLLGNEDVLLAMQSAIMVVCLDSDEAKTPTDAAKLLLHGSGMNRWFDRHNLIVARNGVAGINFEHSVENTATSLSIANIIAARDEARPRHEFNAARDSNCGLTSELRWMLCEEVVRTIVVAFDAFKLTVLRNDTEVLRFTSFGSAGVVKSMFQQGDTVRGNEVDAFVQVALNLTYYRLYGHNCAVGEQVSTCGFANRRTETVHSATAEALAFCRSTACAPLSAASREPGQSELLREAIEAHVKLMEAAKAGQGIDRHLLALVKVAEKHNSAAREEDKIRLPEFMTKADSAFSVSKRWILSTAHCGSKDVPLFGFGPAVPEGFGVAYMVFDKEIRFTVTCQRNRDVPRCRIFCHVLQESLLLMRALLESTAVVARESRGVSLFAHPLAYGDIPACYVNPMATLNEETSGEYENTLPEEDSYAVASMRQTLRCHEVPTDRDNPTVHSEEMTAQSIKNQLELETAKRNELEAQLKIVTAKSGELEGQLSQAIAHGRDVSEKLTDEIHHVKKELQETVDRCSSVCAQLKIVTAKSGELEGQLSQAIAHGRDVSEKLTDEIHDLKKQLEAAVDRCSSVCAQLKSVTAKSGELEGQLSQAIAYGRDMFTESGLVTGELYDLHKQLDAAGDQLGILTAKCADLEGQLSRAIAYGRDMFTESGLVTGELYDLHKQLDVAGDQLGILTAKSTDLERQLSQAIAYGHDVSAKLILVTAELQDLQARLEMAVVRSWNVRASVDGSSSRRIVANDFPQQDCAGVELWSGMYNI